MNILLQIALSFTSGNIAALYYPDQIVFTIILAATFLLLLKIKFNLTTKHIILIMAFFLCGIYSSITEQQKEKEKAQYLSRFQNKNHIFICRCENLSSDTGTKRNNIEIDILSIMEDKNIHKINTPCKSILFFNKKFKIDPGEIIIFKGTLQKIHSLKNPHLNSYEEYLNNRGFHYTIFSDGEISKIKSHSNNIKYLILKSKQRVLEKLRQTHSKDSFSIISGIAFGDSSFFTKELLHVFKNTGTLHIAAASGINISIVTFLLVWGLKKIKIAPFLKNIITIGTIISYVLLTASSPSILRAAAMSIIAIIGNTMEKESDTGNTLAASMILLLSFNPFLIKDIGFQMSSAAIAGIILFKYSATNSENTTPSIMEGILLGLNIETVIMPISIYNFCKIIPFSIIINFLIAPLASIILCTSMTESFLIFIHCPVTTMAELNELLSFILLSTLKKCTLLTPSPIYLCPLPISCNCFYYLGIITATAKIKYKKIIPLTASSIYITASLLYPLFSTYGTSERITFLDVGNGDACVIRSLSGKTIVIDFGPSEKTAASDCGERVIIPFLLKSGINTIDIAIVTHNDDDHAGGLTKTAQAIRIKKLIQNTDIMGMKLPAEFNLSQNEKLIFLAPFIKKSSENENSIVFLYVFNGKKVLFCGDIGSGSEKEIIQKYPYLKADIIKVAHHGSISSSSNDFIERINPSIGIISSGFNNRYNHPSPIVEERFKKRGCKLFRTDLDGGISIKEKGKVLHIKTERKK